MRLSITCRGSPKCLAPLYTVCMRLSRLIVLLFAIFCVSPIIALASGVEFVSTPVFLSNPSAPAGTTITVYTVVVNTANAPFTGIVIFRDAAVELGDVSFVLAPGEARIVSILWTPDAGAHDINALLQDTSNPEATPSVASSTQAVGSFTIQAPPPPPPVQTPVPDPTPTPDPYIPSDTVSPSSSTYNSGAGVSAVLPPVAPSTDIAGPIADALPPAASSTVSALFSSVDNARDAIVGVLDSQIAAVRPATKASQPVSTAKRQVSETLKGDKVKKTSNAGTSTISVGSTTPTITDAVMGTTSDIFTSIYIDILLLLRFILASATLSYLCIAALIFFALYLLYANATDR
jgi:hypothetical protein